MAGSNIEGDVWETLVSGIVAFAAIYAILWLLGVRISGDQAMWMVFAFIITGLLVRNTVDYTVGFVLFTLAVLVAITSFVPSWVSEPFAPIIGLFESLVGGTIGTLEPLGFGVIIVAFTFLMLFARIMITGKKKFVRPAVDLTLKEMARYVRVHLNIARLVVLFAFAAMAIALQQSAEVFGVVGDVVAEVPLFAANVVTALGGYLSLGGELPVIGTLPLLGDLTAAGFLFLAAVVIIAAAAVRWEGSGPVVQFIRNRGS